MKKPFRVDAITSRVFKEFPSVTEALLERPANYNRTREELFDMEADGTARISIEGEEARGTWEATDGGCAITIDGTTNVAPLKDGKLTLGDDEVTVVFKRG